MMKHEFENITGLSISIEEYSKIEKQYMHSKLDKFAWCKRYLNKLNKIKVTTYPKNEYGVIEREIWIDIDESIDDKKFKRLVKKTFKLLDIDDYLEWIPVYINCYKQPYYKYNKYPEKNDKTLLELILKHGLSYGEFDRWSDNNEYGWGYGFDINDNKVYVYTKEVQ